MKKEPYDKSFPGSDLLSVKHWLNFAKFLFGKQKPRSKEEAQREFLRERELELKRGDKSDEYESTE